MRDIRLTASRAWLTAAVAWAFVIIIFGVMPTQEMVDAISPEREGTLTMAGHFAEYAILGSLLSLALGGTSDSRETMVFVSALVLSVGLGAGIELVQALLPYRDCQAADVIVNALGAAFGLVAVRTVSLVRGRR